MGAKSGLIDRPQTKASRLSAAVTIDTESNAVIRVRGLQRMYEMGSEQIFALRSVDLDVESGDYLAIMGQSGSGKSTLMNIIGCLDIHIDITRWRHHE